MSLGAVDHNLVASQYAKFCPKSLSISDLRCDDKRFCKTKACLKEVGSDVDRNDRFEYIMPNSTTKIENEGKEECKNGPVDNKFMFLLGSSAKKKERPSKLIYNLPNMKKIQSPLKAGKPLMVVSLSSHNLFELAADSSRVKGTDDVSINGGSVDGSDLAA